VQPIEHTKGVVRVPDAPGLGIEVDRETLARFAVP
jgi:D-galactarolactone cycloisomerase